MRFNFMRVLLVLFPPAVALGGLVLSAALILVPKLMSIMGIFVAVTSLLGLISPKTPIGRLLGVHRLMRTKFLDRFFPVYRRGLLTLLMFLVYIVGYLFIVTTMFRDTLVVMISIGFAATIGSVVGPLFLGWDSTVRGAQAIFSHLLVALLLFLGPPVIASLVVDQERLVGLYLYAKESPIIDDGIVKSTVNLSEYRDRYKTDFLLTARAAKLLLPMRRPDLVEPWGPVDWYSDRGEYEMTESAIRSLEKHIAAEDLVKLQLLIDQEFTSAQDYIAALAAVDIDMSDDSICIPLLKHGLKNKILRDTFEFREAWREYERVTGEPLRSERRRGLDGMLKGANMRPLPTSHYVAGEIVERYLSEFASLAVASRITFMAAARWGTDEVRLLIFVGMLAISFWLCYSASNALHYYNRRYDAAHNSDNGLFFMVVGFLSIVIAFVAW